MSVKVIFRSGDKITVFAFELPDRVMLFLDVFLYLSPGAAGEITLVTLEEGTQAFVEQVQVVLDVGFGKGCKNYIKN